MQARAAMDRRQLLRLRMPTVGEVVELLLLEGLLAGSGAALVGLTDHAALWWAVAAGMLLALVRWIGALRDAPATVQWDAGAFRGSDAAPHAHGVGAAYVGYGAAGGFDGGAGGDGGGGC